MSCKTLQGKYAEKLEKENNNMNEKINELYNKLDAQDEIIEQQAQKYSRLLKISRSMHTWIFLHSDNEQEVYDELGLTDEENILLGYSGQMILKGEENE